MPVAHTKEPGLHSLAEAVTFALSTSAAALAYLHELWQDSLAKPSGKSEKLAVGSCGYAEVGRKCKNKTMTLNEFINCFDKDNSVVLLEGKRNVLEADKEKLTALGKLLASKTARMTFRSGNADGSDQLFSKGVTYIDNKRLQVITPYSGHRQKTNQAYETISLDDINIASDTEVVYQSKSNKKTEKLIDQFVSGDINRYTIKAAYIIRDTIKAIGTDEIKPATFGIFYDDLTNPKTGGTGHTINVCEQNNIPVIDQHIWFKWLEE